MNDLQSTVNCFWAKVDFVVINISGYITSFVF